MTPEPYVVRGGPFDLIVERDHSDLVLRVIGDKGDLITQIKFPAVRTPHVIDAIVRANEEYDRSNRRR